MTSTVLLSIMARALLHAAWNAIIKAGGNKMTIMLVMTLVQAGFGMVIAAGRLLLQGEIWFWLLGSGLFHSFYKTFLGYGYEQGDL